MKNGWKDFKTAPKEGIFLVFLEEELLGNRIHTMNRRKNVSFIGSNFAFDVPKPLFWMELPENPKGF